MGLNYSINKFGYDYNKTNYLETTTEYTDKKYPTITTIINEYLSKSEEELTIPDSAYLNKGFWKDKFQKTIIRTEYYAFIKCVNIYKAMTKLKNDKYSDPDFGPTKDFSIYKQTKLYDYHVPKAKLKWESLKTMCETSRRKFTFYNQDCNFENAVQGNLGNSWMISGLCAIEHDSHLFYRVADELDYTKDLYGHDEMKSLSLGLAPKIFEPFREYGIFVFKFMVDFDWYYVIIDDSLPVTASGDLVFGNYQKVNEYYLPLFEKAYAKLYGSYECLENGLVEDFLMDTAGFIPMNLKLIDHKEEFPSRQLYKISYFDKFNEKFKTLYDWFWDYLIQQKTRGILTCYCRYPPNSQRLSNPLELLVKNFKDTNYIFNYVNWKEDYNKQSTGIMNMITYQIIDFFEFYDNTNEQARLLRIRNPWGNVEWNGPWSIGSAQLKVRENISKLMKLQKEIPEEEKWTQFKEDGTFLIDIKDFVRIFTEVTISKNLSFEFNHIILKSTWDVNCPGLPTFGNSKALDEFGSNPQIILNLSTVTDLYFTLEQDDGRFFRQYFPYKNWTYGIAIVVMRLWPTEGRVYGWRDPMLKSVLRYHRHVSLFARLPVGRYAVIAGYEHRADLTYDNRDYSLRIDYDCDDKYFQYSVDPKFICYKQDNSYVYR